MNKTRNMHQAMIKVAVDKALRDIQENASRGIRNLVDLGIHFAKGPHQKEFLYNAQKMLHNKNSQYYKLTDRVIRNVDHHILKKFGINLGYNSWTYGAKIIRECEKKYSYNIPWTTIFDFRQQAETILPATEISAILSYGEEIGVYCGIFFINRDQAYLRDLVKILTSHPDSAYCLFLEPELITDTITREIVSAGNIIIALELDTAAENTRCRKAVDILLKNKCLYGTYSVYNDNNLEYIMSHNYMGQIARLQCSFAFLIRENLTAQNKERFSKFLQTTRNAIYYPYFLIDFYDDLAIISQKISEEKCLISIKTNGEIVTRMRDKLTEGINIRTHSLQTILEKALPKFQLS